MAEELKKEQDSGCMMERMKKSMVSTVKGTQRRLCGAGQLGSTLTLWLLLPQSCRGNWRRRSRRR